MSPHMHTLLIAHCTLYIAQCTLNISIQVYFLTIYIVGQHYLLPLFGRKDPALFIFEKDGQERDMERKLPLYQHCLYITHSFMSPTLNFSSEKLLSKL